MTFRRILALAVFAIAAPLASHAQTSNPCGTGYTYTPLPGGGFQCTPITSAPEIGASSSIGGVAVLLGGAMMLRGRKRKIAVASEAVA